jgi:hypothetical protein
MSRVEFTTAEYRNEFFSEVLGSIQKSSWSNFAFFFYVKEKTMDNYRVGRSLLPDHIFYLLLQQLDFIRHDHFLTCIVHRNNHWGQTKGGKETYAAYPIIFEQGRLAAKEKASYRALHRFDVGQSLTIDLCEFIGALIGDGHIGKAGHTYLVEIAGSEKLDHDYHEWVLRPIVKRRFGIEPTLYSGNGARRLRVHSKLFFDFFSTRFGIPVGKKCYTVQIPQEILDAGSPFVEATLRGMFDTDGGVGFDKRKTYKKPYVRINYTSASFHLIEQVSELLCSFNILHTVHTRNNGRARQIQINGETEVKKFLKQIGFSNPRHLNKLSYLTA